MHNLTYILQIAQIFLGLLLIILVLVHSPKGDGMAMLGGAAQLFSSQKGAERNLNKLTTIIAVIFMAISFLIGFKIV